MVTQNEIETALRETLEHKENVKAFIFKIVGDLLDRAERHDLSKMRNPELETFAEYTPKLKSSTYGSDEYKGFLKEMGAALEHHYKWNRHHPEFYDNGIKGMNLVDLIEMLCDWKAATLRHDNGDKNKSLEINQERFNYSDDIKNLLQNTVDEYF